MVGAPRPAALARIAAVALLALPACVGCAGGASSGAMPSHGGWVRVEPVVDTGLDALVLSTQAWVGENDILLDLLDAEGRSLDPRETDVRLTFRDPAGRPGPVVDGGAIQLVAGGPYRTRARVGLDRAGTWTATVEATTAGLTRTGAVGIDVLPDGGTPPLGERVVPIDTPTLASSGQVLAALTSDPIAEPRFYWTSVREALEAGRAFLLVIDSFAFRPTDACGGALGHVHHLRSEFPGLQIIHAEPYRTRLADGTLVADSPDGTPRPAPWAEAWGVTAPPWIFVVDASGRLRAKLTGIFGSDELRSAIRGVTPWAPGGH